MFPLQNQSSITSIRQPKVVALFAGQLFQGKITKIFPNNVASLSANGLLLTARLEAALTVGHQYWFEVKDVTGLPRLRVIDDNNVRRDGSVPTADKWLQQIGLSPSKALENFIGQLQSLKIPFSKEALLKSFSVLTELNQLNDNGYQSIAKMIQKNLPITKESFLSYQAMSNQQPLSTQLLKLEASLAQVHSKTVEEVKALLGKLVSSSHQTTNSPISHLFTLVNEQPGAMQLLIRLGIVKEGTTIQEFYGLIRQALASPANQTKVERLWPGLAYRASQDVNTLLNNLQIPAGKEGFYQLQQLLTLVSASNSAEQVQSKWLQLPIDHLGKDEKRMLQQVLELSTNISGDKTAGSHLRSILTMLGLQYEHDVSRFLQGDGGREAIQAERLKALLMILQQQDLPQASKDQVNQTLQRLTGQQLLMQEQSGPFQQLLFQIPISLGPYQTDMTMQWEGKKNEEGELDPTYCRVLFYLTLERLKETVIDLQIQNRMVAVTIYNEYEKPQILMDYLTPSLKKALLKQDYQLSSQIYLKVRQIL